MGWCVVGADALPRAPWLPVPDSLSSKEPQWQVMGSRALPETGLGGTQVRLSGGCAPLAVDPGA